MKSVVDGVEGYAYHSIYDRAGMIARRVGGDAWNPPWDVVRGGYGLSITFVVHP